jgi:MFS family permease
MCSVATTDRAQAGAVWATRTIFLLLGVGGSAWAPLIPFAKARTGIDDGLLGLVLLSAGLGSVTIMPIAGALAGRLGCRAVITVAGLVLAACLPMLAVVSNLPLLIAVLFAFGGAAAAVDVVMNIQAVIVERRGGHPMMSGFHGFYSLGGIAGSAGATLLLAFKFPPVIAAGVVCVVLLGGLAASAGGFLTDRHGLDGPPFALPQGVVWLIGGLCFLFFLAEGSVLDWSAILLSSEKAMPTSEAGVGYFVFSVAMTVGRLSGDAVVRRLGRANILLFGGLSAAAGFAVAALAPAWPLALVGYLLVGAGCANVVPVLFTSAGRQHAMPEGLAVTAVSTLGYAGVLAGPGAIGLIARTWSLPTAFLILAVVLAAATAGSRLFGRSSAS